MDGGLRYYQLPLLGQAPSPTVVQVRDVVPAFFVMTKRLPDFDCAVMV
jgi:hypothetical protein